MAPLPHIKEINVRNFKRFEKLTIENIGGLNLIVGDNNVGKSSVLEMLMISSDINYFLHSLIYVLYNFRNFSNLKENFIEQYLYKEKTSLTFSFSTYDNEKFEGSLVFDALNRFANPQWKFSGQKQGFAPYGGAFNQQLPFNANSIANIQIPYIPFETSYNHDFANYFSKQIQQSNNKMERLIEDMKSIIPLINYIDINTSISNDPILIIRQQDMDTKMPLGTFGDGAIKLFRILIEMQIHTGSRLMIDEIDTGIHYKRMKTVWKTLIRAAKANNVQLFATTHNEECIKYYKEALEEEGEEIKNESRIIRLAEMEDKQVKAYTYQFEDFAHSIENGNELR